MHGQTLLKIVFTYHFFISYDKASFVLSVTSVRGSLGVPKSYPIRFKAAFTGIGFTSANKAEVKGMLSN